MMDYNFHSIINIIQVSFWNIQKETQFLVNDRYTCGCWFANWPSHSKKYEFNERARRWPQSRFDSNTGLLEYFSLIDARDIKCVIFGKEYFELIRIALVSKGIIKYIESKLKKLKNVVQLAYWKVHSNSSSH